MKTGTRISVSIIVGYPGFEIPENQRTIVNRTHSGVTEISQNDNSTLHITTFANDY